MQTKSAKSDILANVLRNLHLVQSRVLAKPMCNVVRIRRVLQDALRAEKLYAFAWLLVEQVRAFGKPVLLLLPMNEVFHRRQILGYGHPVRAHLAQQLGSESLVGSA